MSKFTLKIDRKAFGDVALRSPGTRALVAAETEKVAARVRAMAGGDEIVTDTTAGKRRARGYVSRGNLAGEQKDGALTRGLG